MHADFVWDPLLHCPRSQQPNVEATRESFENSKLEHNSRPTYEIEHTTKEPSTARMVSNIDDHISSIKSSTQANFPNFQDLIQKGLPLSTINQFESEYKIKLPSEVVTYFQTVNGEAPFDKENMFQAGIFLGLEMLALDDVKREMNVWKEVITDNPEFEDDIYQSFPEGAVSPVYCDPDNWVGLAIDGCGNSIGVDLKPGPNGKVGQVIVWGRDYIDERIVIFDNWSQFLDQVVKDLSRKGEFYRIEDNSYDFIDEQVGNYMDYLFEKKLATFKKD